MEQAGARPGATEHPRPLRPLPWLLLLSFRLLLVLLPGPAASQLRYSVPEEQSPGALVGNVARALGLELRRLGPGCLRINHLGAPSPRYLELDLTNGALFVNERIDREALCEQRPRCLLSLEVLAHNPVAVSAIEVEILDINDNSPRFPRPDYQLQVSESVAPGARFHIESAQDPDVGANSVQKLSEITEELVQPDTFQPVTVGKTPEQTSPRAEENRGSCSHGSISQSEPGSNNVVSRKEEDTTQADEEEPLQDGAYDCSVS